MSATPLCILLTLLAADPAHRTKAPSSKGPAAESSRKSGAAGHRTKDSAARASAQTKRSASPGARAKKKTAAHGDAKSSAVRSGKPKAATSPAPARAGPELTRARELLRTVKQDPVRRRYKHEWEKAIRALERAANGADRAPALLEAGRARYALYRFSSDEADRDRALSLARKASAAGSRDAATFIAAVRREAGDDVPRRQAVAATRAPAPAPPAKRKVSPEPTVAPTQPPAEGAATATAAPSDTTDDPPDTDPVLDRILAQLAEDPAEDPPPLSADPEKAGAPASDAVARAPASGADARPVDDGRAPQVRGPQTPEPAHVPPPRPPAIAAVPETPAAYGVPPPAGEEGGSGTIRRIVIDPGHGGHDTGAIGPTRVREKDVVLAIAKRLARKLESEGFEVALTREDDRYLALAERTALANAHRGDLFVSIHANAHPRRDREGVETWVLDVSSDRYASRLAARENGIVDGADSPIDVRRILADLDAKVSAQASRRLARVVQEEVTGGIRGRFGPVRDLGVKSALFYVLLGARMPAVLVETSFISNRAEEKRLASPRFQDEVASAVARAIQTFAAQQARIAAR